MGKTHKDSFGKRGFDKMTLKQRKNNYERNMLHNPWFLEPEDEEIEEEFWLDYSNQIDNNSN